MLLAQPMSRENLLKCMVRNEKLGLYMLFPIEPDRRCTELLTGHAMQQLLRQLRVFDFVILDTPPMGYFADTEALVDAVDASMLVVRQDRTPAADINDACDLLRESKAHFMGVILNDMTTSLTEGHSYGYGKEYGYGYVNKTRQSEKRH
jgi:Mrp family chromosome partitioning ATPase